jgi:hypothetical protein
LLLYFIEALQNSMEEKQIQLFACAINLHPFINNGEQKVILKHLPNPGNNACDAFRAQNLAFDLICVFLFRIRERAVDSIHRGTVLILSAIFRRLDTL